MLFATVIKQVCLYGNLLAGLEKDVRPELPDCLDMCAGTMNKIGEPGFVVNNAFENPLWQRCLMPGIRNPVDTNALTICLSCKLPKIVYHIAFIHIIHIAHKRVRKVMRDGFKDTVLHNQ